MLASSYLAKRMEVIEYMIEVGDERTLTVRASVTNVVIGVHNGASGYECLGNMGVSATVFGVSVDDLNDPNRGTLRLPPSIEHRTL
jgi:hypothetical protein